MGLLLLLLLAAPSQPPTPAPSVLSRPPEAKASPSAQNPSPAQRQPDTPSPTVNQAQTQSPERRPQKSATQEQAQAAFERWNSGLMTFFTGLLVIITLWLGKITKGQSRTTRALERAYVSMSHCPPGLFCDDKRPVRGHAQIKAKVAVTNHGNTPATLLRVGLTIHASESPLVLPPVYDGPSVREEFLLVPGGECFFRLENIALCQISDADLKRIEERPMRLWLIGYVDYRDIFGDHHTAGYARHYIPGLGIENNLEFDETTNGYNYDHEPDRPWYKRLF